jgi:tetratricopeptide (TPR) repeat protein
MRTANIKKYVFFLFAFFACNQKGPNINLKETSAKIRLITLKHVADSLYGENNYFLAIKYLDTFLSIDSTNGESYFMRASSLDETSAHTALKQEIDDYNRAIKLNYDKGKSYYDLGLCYVGINDSIALRCFHKSLEADPNHYSSVIQINAINQRLNSEQKNRSQRSHVE